VIGQVTDEDRRDVEIEQRVMDAMQREVADDQSVDALHLDLPQVFAAVLLRVAAGHVGIEDERVAADDFERALRGLYELGIERVADVRNEHGNQVGAPGAQALGLRIGRIAELVDRRLHSFAQGFADAVGVVDHVRHRRPRHPRPLRDLADRAHCTKA
jgi:hypothetical protein